MVLHRYFANEEEERKEAEDKCHYVGHLANEPQACVAMTGCPGEQDIDLTIMSEHASHDSGMYQWKLTDEVEVLANPFEKSTSRAIVRNSGAWKSDGDEVVNADLAAAEMAVERLCRGCSQPETALLQLRAGYDLGFRNKVGGDAQARNYIDSLLPHVQVSYCHASLGTKIVIQRIGSIKLYNRYLQATEAALEDMGQTTANDLQGADLMMYMGYDDDYFGTVGIAYVGMVCVADSYNDIFKQSINEWRKSHAQAGHVVAHEIGHNIGMSHDFSPEHTAAGCDKTGIMSYGNPPNKWSHCSRSDFVAHYNVEKNNWCLDGKYL